MGRKLSKKFSTVIVLICSCLFGQAQASDSLIVQVVGTGQFFDGSRVFDTLDPPTSILQSEFDGDGQAGGIAMIGRFYGFENDYFEIERARVELRFVKTDHGQTDNCHGILSFSHDGTLLYDLETDFDEQSCDHHVLEWNVSIEELGQSAKFYRFLIDDPVFGDPKDPSGVGAAIAAPAARIALRLVSEPEQSEIWINGNHKNYRTPFDTSYEYVRGSDEMLQVLFRTSGYANCYREVPLPRLKAEVTCDLKKVE